LVKNKFLAKDNNNFIVVLENCQEKKQKKWKKDCNSDIRERFRIARIFPRRKQFLLFNAFIVGADLSVRHLNSHSKAED